MNEIYNPIKERILQVSEKQEVTKQKFFKKIHASYSNFIGKSKKSAPSADIINEISIKYPDVNLNWLITGKGSMMKQEQQQPSRAVATQGYKQGIPLIPLDAVAGYGTDGEGYQIRDEDIEDKYIIPDFDTVKPDYLIRIKGSSMSPKYNSGDIVAIKRIPSNEFIQWHKPHVIDTEHQGVLVKRIKKSDKENHWKLISDNTNYDPFDIHLKYVRSVAIVVGVIRLE